MKTYAQHAYAILLALAPACGDDGDASSGDTGADSSTGAASSTSGAPTTGAPSTTSDPSTPGSSTTGFDEESSTTADESSTGEDPFADCSAGVLEDDYFVVNAVGVPGPARWYGPGADEDGNLLDDGETEFVVTVTYLALKPDADFELLNQLNVGNAMALFSNAGMVATQLGGSMVCGSLRTFTVWQSEEAMMEFVASEAHLQSISAFPALSRGGSTLSVWTETARAEEITLDVAMARLSDAKPYD